MTPINKLRDWRPRFSLRTIAIVITLVCCYAACWGPTKRQGVDDVAMRFYGDWGISFDDNDPPDDPLPRLFREVNLPSAPMPFVMSNNAYNGPTIRQYYFWFFGYVAKLPYERELPSGSIGNFSLSGSPPF